MHSFSIILVYVSVLVVGMASSPGKHNSSFITILVIALLLGHNELLAQQSRFNEDKFDTLVKKIEADATELARKVEDLYTKRCDIRQLSNCAERNYDHCLSSLPDLTCPSDVAFRTPNCGKGDGCSALYSSYTTSTVALPNEAIRSLDGNPTDPQVIETICFTKELDEYFIAKHVVEASFWESFGVQPSSMFFGSATGAFRIYPARIYAQCGEYDPRIRPWYVAAGSGPKNIIMILDKSGSMDVDGRITLMKEAATRVINTAGIADRIAIVFFDNDTEAITDNGVLFKGTEENKQILRERISRVTARGTTNFVDAFTTAFDILDFSADNELAVDCNTAILFLTDGEPPNDQYDEDIGLVSYVESRLKTSQEKLRGRPIYLFTYSITGGDPEVAKLPSQLACAFPSAGIWTKIDYAEDIVESLSNFYRFFALGLGNDVNADFVAWVEPYRWVPGNAMGTTVSVPVYDRSKEPHLFLGVVGIALALSALDQALGVTNSTSTESFERVVKRSAARCPVIELSQCEIESYRRQGTAGDDALCSENCTESDFVSVEEQSCRFISDYPRNLWDNIDFQGSVSEINGCCVIEGSDPLSECYVEAPPSRTLYLVFLIVGITCGTLLLGGIAVLVFRRLKARTTFVGTAFAPRDFPPPIPPPSRQ